MEATASTAAATPKMSELTKKEQHLYREFKGAMKTGGITDSDQLYMAVTQALKAFRLGKNAGIAMIIFGIPLAVLFIGAPMIIMGIIITPPMHKKIKLYKKFGAMYAEEVLGEEMSF